MIRQADNLRKPTSGGVATTFLVSAANSMHPACDLEQHIKYSALVEELKRNKGLVHIRGHYGGSKDINDYWIAI